MGGDREGAGGRGPRPPPENYKLSCISQKKNWKKQSPPPPLKLSGSAHACLTAEFFNFHFLHVAYFLKLTDYADAQADLRLCSTRYIRNRVIKANPNKMSRSSQRSFLFKCQIVWNHIANLSINLVVKQDAFSNIFFLVCCRVCWCIIHSHQVGLYALSLCM